MFQQAAGLHPGPAPLRHRFPRPVLNQVVQGPQQPAWIDRLLQPGITFRGQQVRRIGLRGQQATARRHRFKILGMGHVVFIAPCEEDLNIGEGPGLFFPMDRGRVEHPAPAIAGVGPVKIGEVLLPGEEVVGGRPGGVKFRLQGS